MGQDYARMSSPEPDEEDIRATHRESAVTEQRSGPTLDRYHGTAPLHGGAEKKNGFQPVKYIAPKAPKKSFVLDIKM